uniref:Uncharacterized protein n=1 Tax=Candidatus Kentrum sp. DK TaxID=2126562 RepID=A0A450SWE3_9GAMM|nr:MAG: hypothetical protein BECKDK2373C_GA0170839_10644 [Candidatus Kentron sp. DK]
MEHAIPHPELKWTTEIPGRFVQDSGDKRPKSKLTIRLPMDTIAFAKAYARRHGITVTDLIAGYLLRMENQNPHAIHPEVRRHSRLLSDTVDAREIYANHMLTKHQ